MAITSILVGPREIINEVAAFAGRYKEARLDGGFSGQEIKEYTQLLAFLKSKKIITQEEMSHTLEFMKSECLANAGKDAIFLGLREQLVSFIESQGYTSAPKKVKEAAAHLAADIQIRIKAQKYTLEGSPNYSADTAFEQVGAYTVNKELAEIAGRTPVSCETVFDISEEEAGADLNADVQPVDIGGMLSKKEVIGPYSRLPHSMGMRSAPEVLQIDPRYR